jgi:hypothetical protein
MDMCAVFELWRVTKKKIAKCQTRGSRLTNARNSTHLLLLLLLLLLLEISLKLDDAAFQK